MYIKLRVIPGSKKEEVTILNEDTIRISVKEEAEYNIANTRVLELMKERFPGKVIRLVSGHHSPSKIISVN
jgi:uncharacterized protein YggU (UPF0235/DUF167 family)